MLILRDNYGAHLDSLVKNTLEFNKTLAESKELRQIALASDDIADRHGDPATEIQRDNESWKQAQTVLSSLRTTAEGLARVQNFIGSVSNSLEGTFRPDNHPSAQRLSQAINPNLFNEYFASAA